MIIFIKSKIASFNLSLWTFLESEIVLKYHLILIMNYDLTIILI